MIYTLGRNKITVSDSGYFAVDAGGKNAPQTNRPGFEINIDGAPMITLDRLKFGGARECGGALVLTYGYADTLEVTVKLEDIGGAVVQTNTVKNITSGKTVNLTRFSSALVGNIAYSPSVPWYEKDISIHLCHSKWLGEGQWREYSPTELGLYPGSTHPWERASYRVTSIGNWCTGNFFPIVVIEDKTDGKSYLIETEGAHSWQIKLTGHGGYTLPLFEVEATSCDEGLGFWHYALAPGESYTAERAVYGVADGGFEEAAALAVSFARADSTVKPFMPLVFNDYMDCVWGMQDPKLIIPLIDAAAEVGCEYFCIDGGWNTNKFGGGNGDWIPKEEYYSETSLADLAEYMKKKGLTPGIWFEFDSVGGTAELFRTEPDAVIRRYGNPVGRDGNYFYNFGNKKVCEYLTSIVGKFYDMGYRYIKNDFNKSAGIGCTNNYGGDSPAEGLIRNADDFYRFIESLYEKFPGLVIENCGSGALRSDNKTLRRFTLQSTSDQEIYVNNPSILIGSSVVMPPEKAGLWVYPYPTTFENHKTFAITPEYIAERADGKETVFNLVTGLMGVFYLSGRIDLCDKRNLDLVKEGTQIYRDIRKYTPTCRPIYPTGMHRINEKEAASFGLLGDGRLMLAVWNITDGEEDIRIDLGKYITQEYKISRVFSHTDAHCRLDGTSLCAKLPDKSAVWVEILE